MPADVKFNSWFTRNSAVVEDDHLVVLEHHSTKDRVRRIHYDRIDSILGWRKWPIGRMLFFGLIIGMPGLGLLFVDDTAANIVALIPISLALIIIIRYCFVHVTYVQINRAGTGHRFTGMLTRKKLDRFLNKLGAAVHESQLLGHEELMRKEKERQSQMQQVYEDAVEPAEAFEQPSDLPGADAVYEPEAPPATLDDQMSDEEQGDQNQRPGF